MYTVFIMSSQIVFCIYFLCYTCYEKFMLEGPFRACSNINNSAKGSPLTFLKNPHFNKFYIKFNLELPGSNIV